MIEAPRNDTIFDQYQIRYVDAGGEEETETVRPLYQDENITYHQVSGLRSGHAYTFRVSTNSSGTESVATSTTPVTIGTWM